jgi:tetratricopeptide (TPR) repeat protein
MHSGKKMSLFFLPFIISGISLFSQTPAVHVQQGDAAFAKQLFDSAIVLYTIAIKADPGLPVTYIKRGKAFLAAGKKDDAIVDFSFAISLDPNSGEAYYNRGIARKMKNSPAQNWCDDFHKAMRLGYQDAVKTANEECR